MKTAAENARDRPPVTADDLPLVLETHHLMGLLHYDCERTIRRMRNAGRIPAPLIDGKHPRWSKASILAWLEGSDVGRARRRR